MQSSQKRNRRDQDLQAGSSRATWLLTIACAVLLMVGFLLRQHNVKSEVSSPLETENGASMRHGTATAAIARQSTRRTSLDSAKTPEQIVAKKVVQFGRSRLEIVHDFAKRFNIEVPDEVEKFFKAVEEGNWEEIDSRAKALRDGRKYRNDADAVSKFWGPILETWGVAEQAHLWPAQKLLDYGHAVLDSLKPGMVYVGGTDPGRFIPTLLNETSDGEKHIIITQNGLADGSYMEYLRDLYDDRISVGTSEDSQRAFSDYIADAKKRFQHDQQFPDEPKQVRPGEDIQVVDGRVTVSGQVAVMDINERILQSIMQKNPDATFAMEESFSLKSTYDGAVPLGPIMQLRATDAANVNAFTQEQAQQSVDYWRATAQQLLADPAATDSNDTLKAYSHMAMAQANLLAEKHFNTEAEQEYRLALQLVPQAYDTVGHLSDLLTANGREAEARQLVEDYIQKFPAHKSDLQTFTSTATFFVQKLLRP